jgi:hypothetical protein
MTTQTNIDPSRVVRFETFVPAEEEIEKIAESVRAAGFFGVSYALEARDTTEKHIAAYKEVIGGYTALVVTEQLLFSLTGHKWAANRDAELAKIDEAVYVDANLIRGELQSELETLSLGESRIYQYDNSDGELPKVQAALVFTAWTEDGVKTSRELLFTFDNVYQTTRDALEKAIGDSWIKVTCSRKIHSLFAKLCYALAIRLCDREAKYNKALVAKADRYREEFRKLTLQESEEQKQ